MFSCSREEQTFIKESLIIIFGEDLKYEKKKPSIE